MNKLTLDAPFQGPPAPAHPSAAAAQAGPDSLLETVLETASAEAPGGAASGAAETGGRTAAEPPQETAARDTAETTAGQGIQDPAQQPPRLSAAVLAQIANVLREGEVPLAAQADLVELHKRIIGLFATLNEGLGDRHEQKAAADRAALSARIDTLEDSVNRMEGALRIEFEPMLKAALAEALAQAAPPPRRRSRRLLAALVLAACAAGLGAWQHAPLQTAAAGAAAWAAAQTETLTGWQIPGL